MDKALVFGTKDCRFESCQGHSKLWPAGLMDKASVCEAGDSRFDSWAGHCCYAECAKCRICNKVYEVSVSGSLVRKIERPCGLMDTALVFGTKDCRFESCQGQLCARDA